MDPTPEQIARFWAKVDKSGGPDACWPWTGTILNHGYGQVRIGSRRAVTHRAAYELTYGPLPPGYCACHNCPDGDNPACCNPAHLWPGTHQQNMADACYKGRTASGERHGRAKLTAEQVLDIRRRRPTTLLRTLAAEYGVSKTAISKVVRGQNWRRVPGHGVTAPPGGNRHLTPDQVREIRRRWAAGVAPKQLAAEFHCSRTNIDAIVTNKTWREVSAA